MKDFFKELLRDILKQATAFIIWSTLVAVGNGVYSYVNAEVKEDNSFQNGVSVKLLEEKIV